jgi:hypothetical protein
MKKCVFAFAVLLVFLLATNLNAQERKNGIREGYVLSASEFSGTGSLDGSYVGFSRNRPLGNSKVLYGPGLLIMHDDGYHVGYLYLGGEIHF